MDNLELRANAMLSEVTWQRNQFADRCAVLSAELAQAQAKIKELEKHECTHTSNTDT